MSLPATYLDLHHLWKKKYHKILRAYEYFMHVLSTTDSPLPLESTHLKVRIKYSDKEYRGQVNLIILTYQC